MDRRLVLAVACVVLAIWGRTACGANATTAGVATSPYPTVTNLGVEWPVTGDDNNNGVVTVKYRRQGSTAWTDGLPLRRVPAGSNAAGTWVNKHAGSVFDLRPNTTYEIQLTLTDADGVSGSATQTVTATTRPIPQANAGATVVNVTTANFATAIANAAPNQILLLANGTYPSFTFTKDGTAGQPIVLRAANTGGAVFSGGIWAEGRQYVYFEGLTVNDGRIKLNGATGGVVRRCTINSGAYEGGGIVAYSPGPGLAGITNYYIADNTLNGPYSWLDTVVGADGPTSGEGIQFTGPGNVVCYNYVKGFRDDISHMEFASAVNQVCNDIYNNDLCVAADDAIEADSAAGNCRILRNRITNCFVGLSSQPGIGGPTYFIRNAMYNVIFEPFKLNNDSYGDVLLHNTIVKCGDGIKIAAGVPVHRPLARNNLIIGGQGGGTYGGYDNGSGWVADLQWLDAATYDFDYDGYGTFGTAFDAKFLSTHYYNLANLRAGTTEKHAVQVDMNVFNAAVPFPSTGPYPERAVQDLRLKPVSAAVDAGAILPNINDGFSGAAPDLGAFELGEALPTYGPRTAGMDESTQVLKAIVVSPTPVNVAIGGTQQFTAAAYDQWGDLMTVAFTWSTTTGSISSSGLLTAGTTAGSFTVKATAGGKNGSAAVTVYGTTPAITAQPPNRSVIAGSTATFSVTATGSPTLAYQWRKNGVNIGGATSASYTTPATVLGDSGALFSCVVSNSYGSVTSTNGKLTVTLTGVAPTVVTQPASVTVTEGQTATFTVLADGTDPLSYQWRRNGVAISGATSDSYTTPPAALTDSGALFTVYISNGYGNTTSTAATLTINQAPQFDSPPTAVPNPAFVGMTVAFLAAATDPDGDAVTYAWDFGDGGTATGAAAGHFFTAPGDYTVTLTISDGKGGSDSQTLTVTIAVASATSDSDGDGVSDAQEVLDGTNPFDANSFKLLPLTVTKLQGSVKFSTAGQDSCSVSGVLPGLAPGFDPKGIPVTLNIGGAKIALTFDAKGKAKSAEGALALTLKPAKRDKATKKVIFLGGDVVFKGKLQRGTWSGAWADEGIDPKADATKAALSLFVGVTLNGVPYGTTTSAIYSAKAGKGGKFKK